MDQPLRPLSPASNAYRGEGTDLAAIRASAVRQGQRATEGTDDIRGYLSRQVDDVSHRAVIGPVLDASGASGVVVHRGFVVAEWGDPAVPEMLFSGTKSVVSTVAGLAFDQGLLDVHAPVAATVDHPALAVLEPGGITWHHLLQQTSQWQGALWGKPTGADAQSRRDGTEPEGGAPGSGWAYNDVRVNLLCLALTALFETSLPAMLHERVLGPVGASSSWSWHGYRDAFIDIGGQRVPVVSGGAHWGGGMWLCANDLALLGELYLRRGRWAGQRLLSNEWIDRTFQPCQLKPDYGYLWWLNNGRRVQPAAPASGRCARGNGSRHLLWVDPDRELVIASHWGDGVGHLLAEVSAAVPVVAGSPPA